MQLEALMELPLIASILIMAKMIHLCIDNEHVHARMHRHTWKHTLNEGGADLY